MDSEDGSLPEKSFTFFLKPIPEEHRERFVSARRKHNHAILKPLSLILFFFSLLFEAQHLLFASPSSQMPEIHDRYSLLYAFSAFVSIMYYVLALASHDQDSRRGAVLQWFYVSFLMVTTILLTWTDLHLSKDFTAVQFGLMGLGLCFSTTLFGYLIIFGSVLASIQILATMTPILSIAIIDRLVLTMTAFMGMTIAALVEGERRRNVVISMKLEEANARLKELSFTDSTTGAYNKRFILELLRTQIGQLSGPSALPLSMVMVELNDFRKIVDYYGRRAGDATLSRLVAFLRGVVRPSDVIARYADDAFILLLPQGSLLYAETCADRIMKGVADLEGPDFPSKFECSCSAVQATEADDPENLIARADKSLRDRKK